MRTPKHTPGPYKVVHDNSIDATYIVPTEPPDSHAIARIYRNHPEYEENAHLIAAAPAMYEALKFLTSEIDLSKLNVRKDFSLMNAHAWAVKVILQAEGKLL